MTTPTLQQRSAEREKIRDSLRLDDLQVAAPKVKIKIKIMKKLMNTLEEKSFLHKILM